MTGIQKYVEWSDTLLVGHQEIDEEHKGIFAFAAALYDLDLANTPPSMVSEIICKLVDYASMHLWHEEELMMVTSLSVVFRTLNSALEVFYPSYDNHR